jgi:hypothetical protein
MKLAHHGLIAVAVVSFIWTSCNHDSGVSDQHVSDYIKMQVPAYLTVKSVTLEKVGATPGGIGGEIYNFKVVATPDEPLFVSTGFDSTAKHDLILKGLKQTAPNNPMLSSGSYDFRGLDQIQYLKQVNQASDAVTVYGSGGLIHFCTGGC